MLLLSRPFHAVAVSRAGRPAEALRIIEEAEVHGIARFTPKSAARWDPARKEFVDFDPPDQGRDISEFMWDYVARVPDVCELQTGVCNPNIVF